MDTKIMRTCNSPMDEVCIEEDETVQDMRNIYKTMDHIKTFEMGDNSLLETIRKICSAEIMPQTFKMGDNALEEIIRKICSTANMPQQMRRSERIQVKLIQKECDLASRPLTYEPKKLRTSSKKKQKSLQNGALRSSNNYKVPEYINGIAIGDGKEYVVVKWKRQKRVEHVAAKDLTDHLKKLTVSYIYSCVRMLSGNENASQEHVPIVTPVIKDSVYQEQVLCENREDYNLINGPNLQLQRMNTSSFKKQQKLFIEKSGILDNYKSCSMDIKLAI